MKTVCVFSGGMDSTVLLYRLLDAGDDVIPLTVNYGQRHVREVNAASMILAGLGKGPHRVVDLSGLRAIMRGSSQTDEAVPVPLGHYAEESMKQTVVPNRNMILLSVAAALAVAEKADRIAFAAHAGDHAIYPDCRAPFVNAAENAIMTGNWHPVNVLAPFLFWSKTAIVDEGVRLKVPFERTWSCYIGGDVHCGQCGTCVERREAFINAGVDDPTTYL